MKNEIIDKSRLNELSPYDDSFPIMLLSNAFETQIEGVNEILDNIGDEVKKSHFDYALLSEPQSEEKMRLVVDTTDDVLKGIQEGKIKLVEENGNLFAQLRENGKYSKKLPIKEDYYKEGYNPEQLSIALQLKTIQDSLVTISNQIKTIDRSVKEVALGQQNDRIGLYYSGVALFIESMNVSDGNLKSNLIAQALKSLTEASFQLTLKLQTDLKYLKNKEYDSQKKMRVKLITERVSSIDQSFSVIHQASMLKAGIYCQLGEIQATCAVLEEYSRFINGTIAPNASLLIQGDTRDNGTEKGVWKKRVNLELDVSNVSKLLQNKNKNLEIEMIEGDK